MEDEGAVRTGTHIKLKMPLRTSKILSSINYKKNMYVKDKEYRMEYRKKEHGCWNKNRDVPTYTVVQLKQHQRE